MSYIIESDNIIIEPIATDKSDEVKLSDPKVSVWYADWVIFLKESKTEKTPIGVIRFDGKPELGKLNITFETEEKYRDRGYMSQALKALSNYLFLHKDIYEIIAVVILDNDPALKALTNAHFVYRRTENHDGVKSETYSIIKPASDWSGLYLVIGLIAGLALGIILSNPAVGTITGVLVGFGVGRVMDNRIKKEREQITGTREKS
ncbi:MAG: GNAT family N-acetyltransferase [Lachnospiraceae bacterium]|nr:GNAT family N-acetyltransferase [Lachnospiraceae bacterium]